MAVREISITKDKFTNNPKLDIASLDPGVRTFQTMYSPNGMIGKFGDDICNKKLIPIAKKIDKLNSLMTKK